MGLVFREMCHSITFVLLALWFTFLVFRFICFGLKRENKPSKVKYVIPNHLQLFISCPGTYVIFPSRMFSVCCENVGQFNATYAIFRHIFAQMGAFFKFVHLCDMLNSCVSLVCGAFKAPYTYVSQTLKKPPDPRSIVKQWAVKLLVKVILCLIAVITRAQVIDILVQDSIYYCTFKYACDKLLQKQRS